MEPHWGPARGLSKRRPFTEENQGYAVCTCWSFNKLVLFQSEGLPSLAERRGRANRPHLKHIMQQCYNKSVGDPNELNHYEPFTPEVKQLLAWYSYSCQSYSYSCAIASLNKSQSCGPSSAKLVWILQSGTNHSCLKQSSGANLF